MTNEWKCFSCVEPTEEDYKLEQMYFLNFIGLKSPPCEFAYNKFVPINIDLCDIFADVSDKSDDETMFIDVWNEEEDEDSRLSDNLDSMSVNDNIVNDSDSDDFDLFWYFIPRHHRLVDYATKDNSHCMRLQFDSDKEESHGSI
jgi:hypothetical protein